MMAKYVTRGFSVEPKKIKCRLSGEDMNPKNILFLALMVLTISSCSSKSTQQINNTPTITRTPTASQTSTQTPTITPSPSATVTPTPELPVSLGTAFPYPVATIGPDNCTQVENLANWGGVNPDVNFSPDGRYFLLGKPSGYTLYETSTMTQVYMKNARFSKRNFAFSVDGNFLVFGDGGNIEVMNLSNGEIIRSYKINGGGITLSPDGQIIVSQYNDKLFFYEVSSGKEIQILSIPPYKGFGTDYSGRPVFSSDGKMLAQQNGSGNAMIVYDLESGQRFRSLYLEQLSEKMKFSLDGTYLVTIGQSLNHPGGTSYSSLEIWNISTSSRVLSHETIGLIDTFSIDQTTVTVLLDNLELLQWNISDGKLLKDKHLLFPPISSQSISPFGDLLAFGYEIGGFVIFDIESSDVLLEINDLNSKITKLTFSPDGSKLATSSPDGTFKIWEVSSGNEKLSLSGFFDTGYYSAITMDEKKLATSFSGGSSTNPGIFLWDISTGTLLRTLDQIGASYLAFSPDGQLLATHQLNSGIIKIWDVNEGKILKELEASGYVVFSPDGKTLATNEFRREIKLWDVETWELLGTLGNYEQDPRFSPDGKLIVSNVEYGKQLHIFNIDSGVKITIPEGSYSFDFLLGGSQLAVYTKDVNIYDTKTGLLVRTIKLDTWTGYNMFSQMVNFPNENFITTFGYDAETDGSALKVYDAGSGEVLCKKLFAHNDFHGLSSNFYFTFNNKMFITTAIFEKYPLSFWGIAP